MPLLPSPSDCIAQHWPRRLWEKFCAGIPESFASKRSSRESRLNVMSLDERRCGGMLNVVSELPIMQRKSLRSLSLTLFFSTLPVFIDGLRADRNVFGAIRQRDYSAFGFAKWIHWQRSGVGSVAGSRFHFFFGCHRPWTQTESRPSAFRRQHSERARRQVERVEQPASERRGQRAGERAANESGIARIAASRDFRE